MFPLEIGDKIRVQLFIYQRVHDFTNFSWNLWGSVVFFAPCLGSGSVGSKCPPLKSLKLPCLRHPKDSIMVGLYMPIFS